MIHQTELGQPISTSSFSTRRGVHLLTTVFLALRLKAKAGEFIAFDKMPSLKEALPPLKFRASEAILSSSPATTEKPR